MQPLLPPPEHSALLAMPTIASVCMQVCPGWVCIPAPHRQQPSTLSMAWGSPSLGHHHWHLHTPPRSANLLLPTAGTPLHVAPVGLETGLLSVFQPLPTPVWTTWVPRGCPTTATAMAHTTHTAQQPENLPTCPVHNTQASHLETQELACMLPWGPRTSMLGHCCHHWDQQTSPYCVLVPTKLCQNLHNSHTLSH